MKTYDVIVIGGGGGTKISSPAFQKGKSVAIIEKDRMGGTCLNRGCIPSKMMIHPANVAMLIREAKKFDLNAKSPYPVNFAKLVKRINKTVGGESKGIAKNYKQIKGNFDYYPCHAKFVSNNVLEVDGRKIKGKKIFIATGAHPSVPPIPGVKDAPYWTSTEALKNTKLPKKLIVIGGGYIGVELGHAYSALGAKVQFIVRGGLIQREDKDVAEEFSKHFTKHHDVHFEANILEVSYKNRIFTVKAQSRSGKIHTHTGDALLMATGVKPNTRDLGLENTNIKTNKRGFIKVNKYLETHAKNVYALGDCVGNYMFRHSVNFEGEYLFDQLFVSKKRKPIKYPPMPHAIFTYPEIAGVGVTEQELLEKKKKPGKDYIVGTNTYRKSAMGEARLSDHGFTKLIFDKKSRKLIGAHIIGEEASTMVHQLIYAMTFKATVDDLLNMIYIHPALPEIVRNAVRKAKAQF